MDFFNFCPPGGLGFAFTPKLIEPLITSPNQAIWLIPTEAFRRASFQRRGKDTNRAREGNSNPELAAHNLFKRDLLMAEQVRVEAEARGLRWLQSDGSLAPNEVALLVEEHFASYLNKENSPYDTHRYQSHLAQRIV